MVYSDYVSQSSILEVIDMNSAGDILSKVLALMEKEVTQTTINTWFDDAEAVDIKPDALVLFTPSDFKRSIIEGRYLPYLKEALRQIFSSDMEVVVLAGSEELEAYNQSNRGENSELPGEVPAANDTFEYTFSSFIIGSANKFAHAAAYAVANKPAIAYNPLFIYGGSGLGKTHLIRAISRFTEQARPDFKIVYVKGDDFTNDVITAIGTNSTDKLRARYRMADLLLVDDIQFIGGKAATQEEFFHTFNSLYEANKQIVLTSDRPPKEIYTLEDRLRTRFEWGLIADIQPPDYETRIAIIKNKADRLGLVIPDQFLQYISNSITANVRQLEGVVKKLLACRTLMDSEITLEVVQQAIRDMFKENPGLKPTASLVIDEVARYFEIEPDQLKSKQRDKETVESRQIAMYITREMTGLSLPEIGREMGGRDHATVIHSIKKIENQQQSDPNLKNLIKDLMSNIRER